MTHLELRRHDLPGRVIYAGRWTDHGFKATDEELVRATGRAKCKALGEDPVDHFVRAWDSDREPDHNYDL